MPKSRSPQGIQFDSPLQRQWMIRSSIGRDARNAATVAGASSSSQRATKRIPAATISSTRETLPAAHQVEQLAHRVDVPHRRPDIELHLLSRPHVLARNVPDSLARLVEQEGDVGRSATRTPSSRSSRRVSVGAERRSRKITLPELMYVDTSEQPAASNCAFSSRMSTLFPATLTARSSATYVVTGSPARSRRSRRPRDRAAATRSARDGGG